MVAYFLILLAILTRFIPHPANFTAVGATAIFSGVYLNKRWSVAVILLIMLISDFFIGFYNPWIMLSVYGSFIFSAFLGVWLRKRKNAINIIGGALLSSVIFYLVTNFAVWAAGTMYPKNLLGLMNCYYLAIPFFRNTIAGDLFYTVVLFGSYEIVKILSWKRRLRWQKI